MPKNEEFSQYHGRYLMKATLSDSESCYGTSWLEKSSPAAEKKVFCFIYSIEQSQLVVSVSKI